MHGKFSCGAIPHIPFIITPTNTYRFFSNADFACFQNVGSIGNSGCNGLQACAGNNGDIDSEACLDTNKIVDEVEDSSSYIGACQQNNATVGRLSCHEEGSCFYNLADVAEGSCQGLYSCVYNSGRIGNQSWYVPID